MLYGDEMTFFSQYVHTIKNTNDKRKIMRDLQALLTETQNKNEPRAERRRESTNITGGVRNHVGHYHRT